MIADLSLPISGEGCRALALDPGVGAETGRGNPPPRLGSQALGVAREARCIVSPTNTFRAVRHPGSGGIYHKGEEVSGGNNSRLTLAYF